MDTDQYLLWVLVGVRFLFFGKEQQHEEGKAENDRRRIQKERDVSSWCIKHAAVKKSQRRGHAQKIIGGIIINKHKFRHSENRRGKTRAKMARMLEKHSINHNEKMSNAF
ncbi:hypothetical protein [Bacillus pumilus]|uniref:hypothetical protein n=1 Tax=Bacillus pumilus TaxID=1408 RepID=UPI00248FDDA8|nr:hypothetical protein [Bacillus pumilus]